MTNQERFKNLMNFKHVDRLPMIEWAGYWDKTVDRWHKEGLPSEIQDAGEFREYFGLDPYHQCVIYAMGPGYPWDKRSEGIVADAREFEKAKERQWLYPAPAFDPARVRNIAELQQERHHVVWLTLNGFFWHPRDVFGITRHLFAFYDQPELMHEINRRLLQFNLKVLEEFCRICRPEFMTFTEDMSYNNGPMLSKELFDEFIAPYYRQIVPRLKALDILPVIDSDGNIEKLIPWFAEVGVDAFLPLERQAGVDIATLREQYPQVKFIGGYDKMVMRRGEAAMCSEFERLLPVMKQGGYIPSVDHQTPPEVSLKNYRIYLKLLKEFCVKAGQ